MLTFLLAFCKFETKKFTFELHKMREDKFEVMWAWLCQPYIPSYYDLQTDCTLISSLKVLSEKAILFMVCEVTD